jgi:hypothetical protein
MPTGPSKAIQNHSTVVNKYLGNNGSIKRHGGEVGGAYSPNQKDTQGKPAPVLSTHRGTPLFLTEDLPKAIVKGIRSLYIQPCKKPIDSRAEPRQSLQPRRAFRNEFPLSTKEAADILSEAESKTNHRITRNGEVAELTVSAPKISVRRILTVTFLGFDTELGRLGRPQERYWIPVERNISHRYILIGHQDKNDNGRGELSYAHEGWDSDEDLSFAGDPID